MPFTTTLEHRDFFGKNHFIELEELFTKEQVDALNLELDETLNKRVKARKELLAQTKSNAFFVDGYDLWRDNAAIQKMTQKLSIASVVSEIFEACPLRIAFDLLLEKEHSNAPLFSKELPLSESSCMQPLTGALFLQLTDCDGLPGSFPLPTKKGNVLLIGPQLVIPWPELFAMPELRLLMIAFGGQNTLYRAEIKDPHSPSLKKLGYVFGDRLSDALHPLLIRKRV